MITAAAYADAIELHVPFAPTPRVPGAGGGEARHEVLAANAELLGCFRPGHACMDNAIHGAAGPRLRADCARIIEIQGHPEKSGAAKITRGYHLPSRFVLHTVGPIVAGGRVQPEDERTLAAAYVSCLELARTIPSTR